MTKLISIAFFSMLITSAGYGACRDLRSQAFRSAQSFAERLERFDTILHDNGADEGLIQWVHHFEEGFLDFVTLFEKSEKCREVVEEFQHFHGDIQELYRALSSRKALFHRRDVLSAWNGLLGDYVTMQNQLY